MNAPRNLFLLGLIGFFAYSASCTKQQNGLFIPNSFERIDPANEALNSAYKVSDTIAVKIAELVLTEIYGDDILSQMPFEVTIYQDSIWIIRGNTKEPKVGGIAYIEIRKSDGAILSISHGK